MDDCSNVSVRPTTNPSRSFSSEKDCTDGWNDTIRAAERVMMMLKLMLTEKEFTKFALNESPDIIERDAMLVLGGSPLPTLETLKALDDFFPPDDVILSVGCRLCEWERCLSSNPWNRNVACTSPYDNYRGRSFHPVKKTSFHDLPHTRSALVILPNDRLLQWLDDGTGHDETTLDETTLHETAHHPQYLAVLAPKDWERCLIFMNSMVTDYCYVCTKILDLSKYSLEIRFGFRLYFFKARDVVDKQSMSLVPSHCAMTNDEDMCLMGLFRAATRSAAFQLMSNELISVRPLPLPSSVNLLEDFPLFFSDAMIDNDSEHYFGSHLTTIFPCQRAVSDIVNFLSGDDNVLSVGCGLAFWEYLISSYCKAKFICTDIVASAKGVEPFHPVQILDAMKAHEAYPNLDVVFISSPDPELRYAEDFVKAQKPRKIIIITNDDDENVMSTSTTNQLLSYLQEWYTDNNFRPTKEGFGFDYRDFRNHIIIKLYTLKNEKKRKIEEL